MVCDWCMTVGVLDLYKRHARTLRLPSLGANTFHLTEPMSAYHATTFASRKQRASHRRNSATAPGSGGTMSKLQTADAPAAQKTSQHARLMPVVPPVTITTCTYTIQYESSSNSE